MISRPGRAGTVRRPGSRRLEQPGGPVPDVLDSGCRSYRLRREGAPAQNCFSSTHSCAPVPEHLSLGISYMTQETRKYAEKHLRILSGEGWKRSIEFIRHFSCLKNLALDIAYVISEARPFPLRHVGGVMNTALGWGRLPQMFVGCFGQQYAWVLIMS